MVAEVSTNNNTQTSSLYMRSNIEVSAGTGQNTHYFNGYMGLENSLPDQNIKTAFNETQILINKNKTVKKSDNCAALMCMVKNNEIVVARSGKEQRAILVYKNHMGYYQRIVLADDEADHNHNPFDNPEIIKSDISRIELKNAFIISASSNFFGKGHNYSSHFDDEILKHLNTKQDNQLKLNNLVDQLKVKATTRNTNINNLKNFGTVENDGMVVCINRVMPGVITGIASKDNYAKLLHESLMCQSAIVEMQGIIKSSGSREDKINEIYKFRETYVQLPFWKEHSYILTLIILVSLGIILGGLFAGPLFLPCLFLKVAHAAAAEGAIMAFGAGVTCASLHYSYHRFKINQTTPEQLQDKAISDAKLYPSV